MAIGFTLIFSIMRVVNFWHGEAYMFGAVILYFLRQSLGMNYVLAVAIAVAGVALLGWVSDKTIMARFRGDMMGGAIATIALFIIFQNMTWYILGPVPRGVSSVLTGVVEIFGARLSAERIMIVVGAEEILQG